MDCKSSLVVLVALVACAAFASGAEPVITTSEVPKTTTPSSETTTTSTTTSTVPPPTTAKPSTTTTPAAPTTVPPPTPGQGNWTVTDDVSKVTCIIAQMTVSAKITYPLEEVNKTNIQEVFVPAKATAEGACGNNSQYIKLSWDKNWLKIAFDKNDTQKLYFVNDVTLSVFADNKTFPNISSTLVNTDLVLQSSTEVFKTNVNQSYRCIREQTLPLSKEKASHSANLVLNKVHLQAFHADQAVAFGAAQDCELDTPDIVPIAVGCALAALVLIVLIAYLVGRRRSQARGYLSM